jgi:hypothetical protein
VESNITIASRERIGAEVELGADRVELGRLGLQPSLGLRRELPVGPLFCARPVVQQL